MRILAIDTSCGAASVAIVESGRGEPLAVMSRPMIWGHADALAPMVKEAMRRDRRRLSLARPHRGRNGSRLLHRHSHRPCDGAGDGAGACDFRGRRFDSDRLRRAALERASDRNHRRHNRCSTRLGLFSVVRSVGPSAGAASLRHAPGMCSRDWRRSSLVRWRRRRDRRQRSPARRAALRPRRRKGSARHCRARSSWSRGRPFDQPCAACLRKTARRAAKRDGAHRQGAGLSLLSVVDRLGFACGRHPVSLLGLRVRLSDWEPFAPLIVSLNS